MTEKQMPPTDRGALAATNPGATKARKSRAALIWGSVVVGLLSLQISMSVIGVMLATTGKSTAVESDYYGKGLHWDDEKARVAASKLLGWNVTLSVGEISSAAGRSVTLTVVDKDGQLVRDARAKVLYFHHARPRDFHEVEFAPAATGLYTSTLHVNRPGLWEFRLSVTKGKHAYVDSIVREVSAAMLHEDSGKAAGGSK